LPEKQLLGKNVLDPRFDMGLISKKTLQQTINPAMSQGLEDYIPVNMADSQGICYFGAQYASS
jgi:hypothetical protein